jgi:serine/threonine protein kinase
MTTWVGPRDEPRRYCFASDGDPIGTGGEGFVYRAWRVADGCPVAVKQLISVTPADWVTQSRRIQILTTVTHPRLGRHLDSFVGSYPFTDDVPPPEEFEVCYTVMGWVEGHDLSDAVHGVDLLVGFGWVRDVAHGAAALHRHPTPTGLGIVHRDIKPSNVRITGTDDRRAVLIDFGIARPLGGATMTRSAGAPGWMPPEAFADPRAVGVRSDTWQVGGLAAWVLLGVPPGALVEDDRRHRLDEARAVRPAPGPPLRRRAGRSAGRPARRPGPLGGDAGGPGHDRPRPPAEAAGAGHRPPPDRRRRDHRPAVHGSARRRRRTGGRRSDRHHHPRSRP